MGDVKFQNGDYYGAIADYTTAIAMDPKTASEVYPKLAHAYNSYGVAKFQAQRP
jgi:lipopolysaccharide biosynthesis regulator YciM